MSTYPMCAQVLLEYTDCVSKYVYYQTCLYFVIFLLRWVISGQQLLSSLIKH